MDSDTQLNFPPCPWCKEPVVEHPSPFLKDDYVFIRHKPDCYLALDGAATAMNQEEAAAWARYDTRTFPSEEDKKLLQDIANWFEKAWAADGFSKPLKQLLERME